MQRIFKTVERIAATEVTALLLGESGTGKELFARAIHDASPRAEHPFVAINCASIPENLLESELYGYEKGAFTGAHKTTQGKIECAQGGTLFLDEIGDMPYPLQAKLLRFLQERTIERVGGRKEIAVDVRVVCATNQHLLNMVSKGDFREDLYYRISEVSVRIPPLRDRDGDTMLIARALLHRYNQEFGRRIKGFSESALQAMAHYEWPGNIRELQNRVKSAAIMADGQLLTEMDLGLEAAEERLVFNLRKMREVNERRLINQVFSYTDHNVSRAAELLGVTRPTLYSLMEKYHMRSEVSEV
jgi:two-component system NtrC family response regulator